MPYDPYFGPVRIHVSFIKAACVSLTALVLDKDDEKERVKQ